MYSSRTIKYCRLLDAPGLESNWVVRKCVVVSIQCKTSNQTIFWKPVLCARESFLPSLLCRLKAWFQCLPAGCQRSELGIKTAQFCNLGRRWGNHCWWTIPRAQVQTIFRDAVEICEELIELTLRNRIVLMIMTTRTADGEAKKSGRRGIHTIDHIFGQVFIRNDSRFGIATVITIESGGQPLLHRGIRQQITGKLFDNKLVIGLIAVEGLDNPIAPAPHLPFAIALIAAGIGIARHIQPAERHSLTIARAVEQTIYDIFIGCWRLVTPEGVDLIWRRWQAGQIER